VAEPQVHHQSANKVEMEFHPGWSAMACCLDLVALHLSLTSSEYRCLPCVPRLVQSQITATDCCLKQPFKLYQSKIFVTLLAIAQRTFNHHQTSVFIEMAREPPPVLMPPGLMVIHEAICVMGDQPL
jgi:hypothetical protein